MLEILFPALAKINVKDAVLAVRSTKIETQIKCVNYGTSFFIPHDDAERTKLSESLKRKIPEPDAAKKWAREETKRVQEAQKRKVAESQAVKRPKQPVKPPKK